MDPKTILVVLNSLAIMANYLWTWMEKRSDKTNERIQMLEKALGEMKNEVTAIKAHAETAPTHQDLSEVYGSINGLAASVNQLVGENRSQTALLNMIINKLTGKGE